MRPALAWMARARTPGRIARSGRRGHGRRRLQRHGSAKESGAVEAQSVRTGLQVSEANLAVILIDALSYHEGWVYEDKFAEKLGLAPKAVRRTLQFLQRQGFVAREHRAERKQGDKVESTVEYEDVVAASRTVSYVSIDYPHFYDMLRLRLHLAKKAASDKVDDGSVRSNLAAPLGSSSSRDLSPCLNVEAEHLVVRSRGLGVALMAALQANQPIAFARIEEGVSSCGMSDRQQAVPTRGNRAGQGTSWSASHRRMRCSCHHIHATMC